MVLDPHVTREYQPSVTNYLETIGNMETDDNSDPKQRARLLNTPRAGSSSIISKTMAQMDDCISLGKKGSSKISNEPGINE